MRTLPVVLLLAVAAHGQSLIEPCGGSPSCVRVGIPDGGQVQLGGVLQSSRYATPDGGGQQVRIAPLTSGAPIAILGNQGRFVNGADVVIGGTTARDGGSQVLVQFQSGNTPVAALAGNGVLTVNGVTNSGTASNGLFDAGAGFVANNFGVGGLAYLGTIDAGAGFIANNLGIGGTVYSVTSKPDALDAGRGYFSGPVAILEGLSVGHCTLNAASPAVCTDTVEKSTVICVCAPVGTTAAIAAMNCAVSVTGTTLTVTAANAANAEVNWHCF